MLNVSRLIAMMMMMKISMLLLQTLPHERGGKQKSLDQVSSVHLPQPPPLLILVVLASKRETPIFRSASNDSESDTYGGSRARSLIKKNRRRQQDTLPAPAARWSNRRAAQVSAGAYQESEADEEDSEMMTPIQALEGYEDNSPYIEVVLKHRPKDGVDISLSSSTRDDFEYYVKWQGKSYYHATWEDAAYLGTVRGHRRLENYYRKVVLQDVYFATDPDVQPEEKEKWMLDRERDADALLDYVK